MANKKFTELTQASTINETDIVATSQYSGGIWSSLKATISQIANKIVSGINYNTLDTTDKTIIGAINEAAQSGGSGGHTILDDDGTALSQEDNLQFVGVYSEDDSVNDTTKVNIVREMTQAQYDLLSADEKKGIIHITDKNYVCEASEVKYSNSASVETEIDKKSSYYANGIVSSKNLLFFPYNGTSFSENGVDWTVYPDGTVMANGKAVGGNSSLTVRAKAEKIAEFQEGNSYKLTGCPSGGGLSTYGIRAYCRDSSDNNIANAFDSGSGVTFTLPIGSGYNYDSIFIRVYEGATVDHVIFKPMIRLVDDTDETYRPFAMTNKQLTDVINNVPSTAGTYTLQAVRNSDNTITYSWV